MTADQRNLIEDPRDGTEVHLDLGASALIALPASAGTGYRWRVVAAPESARVAETDLRPTAVDDPAALLPGRAGHTVFEVTAAGAGPITFALQRDWEPEPLRTVTVRIVVE